MNKKIVFIVSSCGIIAMIIGSLVLLLILSYPKKLFKEYIASPIPPSVRILRANKRGGAFDNSVNIRFRVNKNDLKSILKNKRFFKVKNYSGKTPKWFKCSEVYQLSGNNSVSYIFVDKTQTYAEFLYLNY
jgi:hypothetical protein